MFNVVCSAGALQYLEATDEDLAEVIEKLKGNEDMQQCNSGSSEDSNHPCRM